MERVEHLVLAGRDREHQYARIRIAVDDLRDRLDAAHDRHRQVHHDDVGLELGGERNGGPAVCRLARDLEPLALEQPAEPAPEERVVVYQEEPTPWLHEVRRHGIPPPRSLRRAREADPSGRPPTFLD